MIENMTVQEALKLVEDSHVKYVTRLQEARLLLNFASAQNIPEAIKTEITAFLEKTK